MNKTTIAVAAGLLSAFASASQAQYPLTYTLGYSSFTGCNVGPAMLTLPGGGVYYVPGTGPGTGGINVGVCWWGPTNGSEYTGVPTGWLGLGYTPPPPPPPTYNDDDDYSNVNNDEELPPNIHLVNSRDDNQGDNNQGDNNQGGNNDGGSHEGGGGPGVTATDLSATTTTPEPASLVLVGSGLAGLAGLGWRRRNR